MKSTRQFMSTPPSKQSEVVSDGVRYIRERFDSLAHELGILNTWVQIIVSERGAKMKSENWKQTEFEFKDAADKLTDAISKNSQLLKLLKHEIPAIDTNEI